VGAQPGVEKIQLAEDIRAPREFHMWAERDEDYLAIDARLGPYNKPECLSLTLRKKDGSSINWETLRHVPLDEWLTLGLTLALEIRVGEPGLKRWVALGEFPAGSEIRNRTLERLRRSVVDRSSSRRPLTPEFLAAVAERYRAAVMTGERPIMALEEAFPTHDRSTINKWVARARSEGLLEPAKYNRRKSGKKGGSDGKTANRSSRRKSR
jgi:ribosomal 50S subunit-associated protein YjgA (DUF615 family)